MEIIKGLKFYSTDEVFKKASKSKAFIKAYNEEAMRMGLVMEIKRVRKEKKMTQAMVAKKAKMPQSVIARIESGQHGISLDTLNRIVHALGKRVQLV